MAARPGWPCYGGVSKGLKCDEFPCRRCFNEPVVTFLSQGLFYETFLSQPARTKGIFRILKELNSFPFAVKTAFFIKTIFKTVPIPFGLSRQPFCRFRFFLVKTPGQTLFFVFFHALLSFYSIIHFLAWPLRITHSS